MAIVYQHKSVDFEVSVACGSCFLLLSSGSGVIQASA